MRTASPPYDRHLGEVNDLLDAGESRPEIRAAIEETELHADQKVALCLVLFRSDDPRSEASEDARREAAITQAKGRAWRVAIYRRKQRRLRGDERLRYENATKYGESGEAISPPLQTLITRARRLLRP